MFKLSAFFNKVAIYPFFYFNPLLKIKVILAIANAVARCPK